MKTLLQKFLPLFASATLLNPVYAAQDNCQTNTTFKVGAGIYDITGPAAEEGMMGYGMIQQQTAGILQRLWARAFVFESACNGKRIVFVNADLGQIFQGIKQRVVQKLTAKYGDRYTDDNVLLTATHTHSGPGGFSTYAFYNLTTLGFNQRNFEAIADGIVAAIDRAQNNLADSKIKLAQGELTGINYNRSPQAYLANPESERARYANDTDTTMNLLRFDTTSNQPQGLINWFPIHGVSMNNKNHLINGDNKGYAEYLFEKDFAANHGPHVFVAAFAQANAGDVSPNPYGQEGGSGEAGIQAVEKAGLPQYQTAKKLFNEAAELITGGIDYRHTFIAMDDVTITPHFSHGEIQKTCPAAIGVSMFAGTQDGEGVGKQGVTCDTMSDYIPQFLCELSTTTCQGVKPIGLQTGQMKPYPWTPNIVPLQILKLGNFVIVAVPFEVTTMTGRRIKETVAKELPQSGNYHIVLSTLANAYVGYVATYEEYQLQRYEGASTHFGPWTEASLRQEYSKLAKALVSGQEVDKGPMPIDLSDKQINLQPEVLFDDVPLGKRFGSVYQDVKPSYKAGETISVSFWGAHPKNNFRTQAMFLAVQQLIAGKWKTVRTDNDWDTEYHWQRSGIANSIITIVWRTPLSIEPGSYRIVHLGEAKRVLTGITSYAGHSTMFTVS